LESTKIIDDKIKHMRKKQHNPAKNSDESSGFDDVLERKNFEATSPSKQQTKSGKTLKQTIKKQIENRLFSNNTKKKLTTNLRNVVSEKKLLSPKQRQFVNQAYQQVSKVRAEAKLIDEYEFVSKRQEDALERRTKQFKYTIKDYKERERLKGS